MESILLSSDFCIGPMSKNIVDSVIDYANQNKVSFTFIPSRRQIEWNGGYVGWTTKEFSTYVKTKTNLVAIQRDHGGPGQGLFDDDGFESLKHDALYFDSIHIDPWKKYPLFEDGLEWTVKILNYCHSLNKGLYYEIGTEEAIRRFSTRDLVRLLEAVKELVSGEIWNRIIFCVVQGGTRIEGTRNVGMFDLDRMKEMLEVTADYGKYGKEHNGDYLDETGIRIRFRNGLGALNIAPEFGVFETDLILKGENNFDQLFEKCYKSEKWVKWVDEKFDPHKNKKELVRICCHYLFNQLDYKIDTSKIYQKIDGLVKSVYQSPILRDVIRVHPPPETQKINTGRIRQHRAERLEPFGYGFFEVFISSLTQEDFRYYPYIEDLRVSLRERYKAEVLINNGSSEAIRLFFDAFCDGQPVIITQYSYPMHRIFPQMHGSKIIEIPFRRDLKLDFERFLNAIDENVSCICFANPNSPFGDYLTEKQIEKILRIGLEFRIPVLIDEAYLEYSSVPSSVKFLERYQNLVISKTFSKAYGAAGIRVGYLLGNPTIISIISKLVPTYETSNVSAKFAQYLLHNEWILIKYLDKIKIEKNKLREIFKKGDIEYHIGEINTIYIKPNNFEKILAYLKEEKILYRTRKLPYSHHDWLALVLFPGLSKSKFMIKIYELHSQADQVWKDIFDRVPWVDQEDETNLLKISGHISATGAFDNQLLQGVVDEIKERLSIKKGEKILELGCGPGTVLDFFKEQKLCGVDYSEKMIRFAAKNVDGEFYVGEINDLYPFEDKTLDVIISHSCIQYVPSLVYLKEVLDECTRCLKAGGRLSFTDVNNKDLEDDYIEYRIEKLGKEEFEKKYSKLKHFSISPSAFEELLSESFKDITCSVAIKRGDENKNYRFNIYAYLK
jgi:histidinol-phosphate aminotransferase